MTIRNAGQIAVRAYLALAMLFVAGAATAACKDFVEHLPPEVGGGCVMFTICCYNSHCEVFDVVDQPGLC